jgi:hypothetical protein
MSNMCCDEKIKDLSFFLSICLQISINLSLIPIKFSQLKASYKCTYTGPLHTILWRSEGPRLLSAGGGEQPLPERPASPLRKGQGAVQLNKE